MGKPGRRREATYDIEKLMRIGFFDLEIMVMVEQWIDDMDKPKYLKLKKAVDQAKKNLKNKRASFPKKKGPLSSGSLTKNGTRPKSIIIGIIISIAWAGLILMPLFFQVLHRFKKHLIHWKLSKRKVQEPIRTTWLRV